MVDIAIVSVARTPIGKAYRGSLNATHGATLAAHAISHAIARSNIAPDEFDDVIMGCAMPEGTSGMNIARQAVLRAGLPVSVTAQTVVRACASSLSAIGTAANAIACGDGRVMVAGGFESISLVQNEHQNVYEAIDPWLQATRPTIFMSMLATADIVARRYGVSRSEQDAFALESQRRVAEAQAADRFGEEIVAMPVTRVVKAEAGVIREQALFDQDECNRPQTQIADLEKLKPVLAGNSTITAGNSSQLSDGAAACVMMNADEAARRGLTVLGLFRGLATAGCEPEEMGIGPISAVAKLLKRFALSADDIGLWELNEAFASQALYCQQRIGIPSERLNVNGGAIAMGHPYGMTGARMVGTALLEGRRRGAKWAIVSMCVAGGQGVAGLLELV